MDVLVEQPLLTLFLVLALGTLLGAVRVVGVAAGPAGALFAGLLVSALVPDVAEVVPTLLGTLGLTLFAYTVGLASGPSFFAGLRRGAPLMALAAGAVVLVAVVAAVLGRLAGLSAPDVAGAFAGSVTNTPALAAAVDVAGGPTPVVGYSLTYPFGVLGMLGAVAFALRRAARHPLAEDRVVPEPETYATVEVGRGDLPALRELASWGGSTFVFSRVRRDGLERTPGPDERLRPGDLVTVIGPRGALADLVAWLGRPSERDLVLDRQQLDFRRIVLSNPRYAGATVADLDLQRFDAVAGFVRRGDVDVMARHDLTVELGDRIRVVAPRDRLREVARELGDSERAVVVADPIGFSLGLLLGLGLGVVPIPLPGTTLVLGTAAAPLLVGLALGRLGRTGPVVWQLPFATNQSLRQFGVLLFLAVVGLGAGPELVAALGEPRGLQLFTLGVVLTSLLGGVLVLVARRAGLAGPRVAGTLAGTQGQPAVLAFATERTDADDRVALAYALLFPPAFVTKILAAQVLAGL